MFEQVIKSSRYDFFARSKRLILLVSLILCGQLVHRGVAAKARPLPSASTKSASQTTPEAATLELGKSVERELAGRQEHSYKIILAEGQYVSLIVEQRGIDVMVSLLGTKGDLIAEFDSEIMPRGLERVRTVTEGAGNYSVTVKAKYKRAPAGRYEIRLAETRMATENDQLLHQASKLTAESIQLHKALKEDEALSKAEEALRIRQQLLGPATTMVGKLLNYEFASPTAEMVLFADLNDGFDFESASRQLGDLVPSSLPVNEIFRSRNSDAATKANLLEALNRGQKIVNSVGHGSVTTWRGNMLTTHDARALKNSNGLGLFLMMNCLNGYFLDPLNESLAEGLMRNEHGGAIAVWASSGMTLPNEHSLMNQQLYRTMFGKTNLTLGEHVRFAKLATSDADVQRSWILLGDPTVKLR